MGKLIVIEGSCDGVGKSTQYKLLIDRLINEKEYDNNILNEALVYEDIYKQQSRKTCATLPYRGILEVLEKY